jgi:MFS-type transporter involved in bile tolerance (Atg22 family)
MALTNYFLIEHYLAPIANSRVKVKGRKKKKGGILAALELFLPLCLCILENRGIWLTSMYLSLVAGAFKA